jgi:four helix bundle protein
MSNNMAHERLRVYDKAASFVRLVGPEVDGWPSSHSVRDQIDRAMESSVTNLAKAAWLQPSREAVYYLECSLGSVLETAACLDVAWIYDLIDKETVTSRKLILWEIASMEIGLRKVWCSSVREEVTEYGEKAHGFPHDGICGVTHVTAPAATTTPAAPSSTFPSARSAALVSGELVELFECGACPEPLVRPWSLHFTF